MHIDAEGGAVLRPVASKGLHPNEVTVAELLRVQGYATACIGKWHLGDQLAFLPTRQGFETFYGIPYSDDMTPRPGRNWPPLPLMENELVIEAPADRDTLTQRYTARAIEFIEANQDHPFFLFLAHAMPGSTAAPFSSEPFRGRSDNGPYGDAVEELDWSTGEILKALNRLQLDQKTLIVWTSDNGAPRRDPPQGSNLPLGGWGYTTREGGMRVPCVARWPNKIPVGGSCDELATMMDLLPTFVRLAGGQLPSDRKIDGQDIWPLLRGDPEARTPHEAFYYYHLDQLQAVRSGRWKLYLPLVGKRINLGDQRRPSDAQLFDLHGDPGETLNVAQKYPDVVNRLLMLANIARRELGDGDQVGEHQRPAGHEPRPTAQERIPE
jgi:arylsulfatase A-like enzyme